MHILKFGGTSVATDERRATVARIVARAARRHSVWVVVSALAGITDLLTTAIDDAIQTGAVPLDALETLRGRHHHVEADALITDLSACLQGTATLGECGPLTRGRILAVGERLAVPCVAKALTEQGLKVHVIDGGDLIAVDGDIDETTVTIDWATTRRRTRRHQRRVPKGHVALVPGFIAADRHAHIRTLGRGASDLSATVLARAMRADRVEIWTDVAGVMSADPRRVPDATTLPRLDYSTADTLARFGATVLHPDALTPLIPTSIPVVIRGTLSPKQTGTVVSSARPTHNGRIRAVATRTGLARLTLPATPAGISIVGARAALAAVGIPTVQARSSERHLTLTLSADHAARGLRALQRGYGVAVGHESGLALVAAVAAGGPPDLASLGRLMAALERSGIVPRTVTPADDDGRFAIVILVNDDQADQATRVAHHALVRRRGGANAVHRVPAATSLSAETGHAVDHAHVPGKRRLG